MPTKDKRERNPKHNRITNVFGLSCLVMLLSAKLKHINIKLTRKKTKNPNVENAEQNQDIKRICNCTDEILLIE